MPPAALCPTRYNWGQLWARENGGGAGAQGMAMLSVHCQVPVLQSTSYWTSVLRTAHQATGITVTLGCYREGSLGRDMAPVHEMRSFIFLERFLFVGFCAVQGKVKYLLPGLPMKKT